MKLISTLLLASALALAGQAQAELVAKDWATSGDALLTYDVVNQTNWVDLTVTMGHSYNEVESLLQTEYLGWRLPSEAEVFSLFNAAFESSINSMWQVDGSVWVDKTSGNADEVIAYNNATVFTDLFGTGTAEYAYGLYKAADGTLRMMGVYDDGGTRARIFGMDYTKDYNYTVNVAHPQFATMLVANNVELPEAPVEFQSVPVPASLGLLTIAMAGMRLRRKK